MGQREVLEFLKKKRLEGSEEYYTYKQIRDGLCTNESEFSYRSVGGSLPKLLRAGEIEYVLGGSVFDWQLRYRYKLKEKKVNN